MSQPLLRLAGLWQQFQQSAIAVKRLGEIMNAPSEPYSIDPARDNAGQDGIEIRDLSFRYGDNRPYLYGRTLARVNCDEVDANAEQAWRGLAWAYDRYGTDRSLYPLQDEVRANRVGLWQDKNAIPPWEWRRQKR